MKKTHKIKKILLQNTNSKNIYRISSYEIVTLEYSFS